MKRREDATRKKNPRVCVKNTDKEVTIQPSATAFRNMIFLIANSNPLQRTLILIIVSNVTKQRKIQYLSKCS